MATKEQIFHWVTAVKAACHLLYLLKSAIETDGMETLRQIGEEL